MKNKFIIFIVCFVIVGIVLCMAFILKEFNENKTVNENNNEVTQNNGNQEVVTNNSNDTEKEDDYELVEPTSKIGTQILENLNYIYVNYFSDMLYDEMDTNGFSEKAKLIYTYSYIISTEKYIDLIEFSEEYQVDCISEKNMEKVAKEIFGNDCSLKHQDILTGNIYKSEGNVYQVIPMGFGGMNAEYSFDIPFEIKEYNDRVEVMCNRLYLTTDFSTEEYIDDEEGSTEEVEESNNSYINVFSNRNRSTLLLKIDNQDFIASSYQGTLLNEYIKDKSIDTNSLKNNEKGYIIYIKIRFVPYF